MKNKHNLGSLSFAIQPMASFTWSQLFVGAIQDKLAQQDCKEQAAKKILQVAWRDVGISQPTWSRVMNGESELTFDKINILCDRLGLDVIVILEEVRSLSVELTAQRQEEANRNRKQYDSKDRQQEIKMPAANKDMLFYCINHIKNKRDDNMGPIRA